MNDYDDSDDYSSSNSFRARSNTWPLNRPEQAVPNSVCIDETLPEIELEEDDLFTTNEHWTSNVDHDIMSWDPILNAHLSQPPPPPLPPPPPQHSQPQQQLTTTTSTTLQQSSRAATVHHHHQPQQQPIQQQHQHQHEVLLANAGSSTSSNNNNNMCTSSIQRPPPHQTLNSCLEAEDPNEYHLQQLHHLRLDNGQVPNNNGQHYMGNVSANNNNNNNNNNSNNNNNNMGAALSQNHIQHHHHHHHQQQMSATTGGDSYNISPDHQQLHLQPLTSASYLHQQNDLDLKTTNDHHHQHQHPQQQHLLHHQQQHHQHSHQLHHLPSSISLDQSSSHILSSSLSTSGIGLSEDLEDLDYKSVDPSTILQQPFDELQQPQTQEEVVAGVTATTATSNITSNSGNVKQSNSSTSSKTKLNTPRRNAWGNMSYADLISQAINSTNDKRLTLSQIYDWMVQHVPYFKDKGDSNSSAGWKNSVRHNLSLHNRFKRLQNEGTGKSSWWTINPETNVGKCARRRAASMEASKYEKKRGRAKKRADAIRQGLVSYPSLTNTSLHGSTSTLDQQPLQHHQSTSSQFGPQQQQPQQQAQTTSQPQTEGLNNDNLLHNTRQPNTTGLYAAPLNTQQQQQQTKQYEQQQDNNNEIQQPQPQISHLSPTTTPPLQATPQQEPLQVPNQVQLQVHHQMQKMETHEIDSYYIQNTHHDTLHLQEQNQHQQILSSSDHMDLFGRHAIYMSEPCNDCNCSELINCGTNAMSYT